MNRNIFIYWNDKEYKLITILKQLLYEHSKHGKGYNIILLNNDNINNYIENITNNFYELNPDDQLDFIRTNIICEHGGIWLNINTIVIDNLDEYFNYIEKYDGFFVTEESLCISTSFFGSKKRTKLLSLWQQMINKKIENYNIDQDINKNDILKNIYNEHKYLYNDFYIINGNDSIYPNKLNTFMLNYIFKSYDNYKTIIRENQHLIILSDDIFKYFEEYSINEILNGLMPINYFINKSLNNIKQYNNSFLKDDSLKDDELKDDTLKDDGLKDDGLKLDNGLNKNYEKTSIIQSTNNIGNILNQFIYYNNCNSILDIGCGDLTYIQELDFFKDNLIKYTGIDNVENNIKINSSTYTNKKFIYCDMTIYKDIEKVSLIILKDVIVYLKNEDVIKIFNNIKNKFKYLAITSDINDNNIDDFNNYNFSQKNLHIEPFNIQYNFIEKYYDSLFNKNFYIYKHDDFYK